MDGKDKIIEKILSDADNYRESVTLKAKENAEKVVSDAEDEATRIISEALDFLKKEEEETLKRRKTLAVLDGKKLYLSGKSRAVEKVFSTCLYKLNRLDKSTYKSIIGCYQLNLGNFLPLIFPSFEDFDSRMAALPFR